MVKNSVIYVAGGLLPKVVSFLLLPLITCYLSKEDYGIVTAVTTLSALIGTLATLNLPGTGMFRCYYDYPEGESRHQFVGTIITSVVILSVGALIGCLAAHVFLQKIYPTIPFYPFYFLALMALPLQIFFEIFQLLFRINERPVPYVLLSSVNFLLSMMSTILLVVVYHMGAEGILWAAIIAHLLTLPVMLWLSRDYYRITWAWPMLRNALSFSLQSIPAIAIAALTVNLDRYLINRLSSTEELGIYGVADKLASVFAILGTSVLMAFDPMFFRVAATEPPEKSRPFLGHISTQLIIAFIFIGVGAITISRDLVALMMDRKFAPAALVVPWLIASAIAGVADVICSAGAKYAKKIIWFVPIYIARGVLVVGLDILLVPKLGALGAGIANLVLAVTMMFMRFGCSRFFWPVPINVKRIGLVLLVGLIPSLMGNLLPERPFGWNFAAKVIIFALYAFWVIRLMHWGSILVRCYSGVCFGFSVVARLVRRHGESTR